MMVRKNIFQIFLLLLGFLILGLPPAGFASPWVDPKTPANALPVSGGSHWGLVFSDEFNTNALDTTKWGVDVSTQSRAARLDRGIADWWWKAENVSVDGSNVVLAVIKHDHNTMYCGSISSDGLYEPTYGYLEARVQIANSTKDTHTAFWLQGHNMNNVDGTGNDGAEVDIFESAWFGDYTKSVVHIDGYGVDHRASTKQYSTPGMHNGYNVFGLEWTASYMKIYYNGELKVTYDGIWVPQTSEYIWLSDGASFGDIGTFTNEPIGFLTSAKFDYVRVWQSTTNFPPVFTVNPMERPLALVDAAYSDTLAGSATDRELDPLTYSKVSGPLWLSVAVNGALSGTPSSGDWGTNTWTVQVVDDQGGMDQATLRIMVQNPGDPRLLVGGPLLNGNFNANPGTSVTFSATEVWYNTKGGQDQVATRSDVTYLDGTQNATLQGGRGFGVDTGYSIIEGESFDFSYVWKDDWNWVDSSDQVTVSLFITADNTIAGARTDLVVDYSGIRKVDNAYEAISRENVYTATASEAGKKLFAAIETTSAGFARLDNFELSVKAPAVQYDFTVASAHGLPSPAVGTTNYTHGTVVNFLMPVSKIENGTTQYVANGWVGTGSLESSATGTNGVFTITNTTSMNWQWSTNYWINFGTTGN